jgi:hypothetical protein
MEIDLQRFSRYFLSLIKTYSKRFYIIEFIFGDHISINITTKENKRKRKWEYDMREEDLMRLLAGIGGAITLIETLLGFNERNYDYAKVMILVISIILAVIVLFSVIKPGNPVPMNWLLFVALGIIIIIFSSLAGGILILIAGFIGYTER